MSIGVLFVCLGNICRSPSAQGILEKKLQESGLGDGFFVDSCGTANFNVGKSPDPRAIAASERAGYDISRQIARQIEKADYEKYRYIIAMDRTNLLNVQSWAPPNFEGEIKLMLDYCKHRGSSQIPDPYYAEADHFDGVISLLEQGVDGLVRHLKQHHSI